MARTFFTGLSILLAARTIVAAPVAAAGDEESEAIGPRSDIVVLIRPLQHHESHKLDTLAQPQQQALTRPVASNM